MKGANKDFPRGLKKDTYYPEDHRGIGLLYGFETAYLACPNGWHVATIEDWEIWLKQFNLGMVTAPSRTMLPKDYGLNLLLKSNPELAHNGSKYQRYWAVPKTMSYNNINYVDFFEGNTMSHGSLGATNGAYYPCRCIMD